MNRKARGMLVAGLLTLAGAQVAGAQARGYVGFGGGVSIPTGEFADAVNTGVMGQVVAGITGPTGVIGGRVNGTYTHHGFDLVDDARIRFIGAMGDVVFSPGVADAKLRPYLLGGLGFQNFSETDPLGGDDFSETEFAFNFGGGVNIALGRMKLFIEGRWLSIRTEDAVSLIPLSIGLRFGGN